MYFSPLILLLFHWLVSFSTNSNIYRRLCGLLQNLFLLVLCSFRLKFLLKITETQWIKISNFCCIDKALTNHIDQNQYPYKLKIIRLNGVAPLNWWWFLFVASSDIGKKTTTNRWQWTHIEIVIHFHLVVDNIILFPCVALSDHLHVSFCPKWRTSKAVNAIWFRHIHFGFISISSSLSFFFFSNCLQFGPFFVYQRHFRCFIHFISNLFIEHRPKHSSKINEKINGIAISPENLDEIARNQFLSDWTLLISLRVHKKSHKCTHFFERKLELMTSVF